MKTISVRDLRAKSAQIWRDLSQEKDMVITSKGKPVGILSTTSEDTLEASLRAVRRARATLGLIHMQLQSVRQGKDRTPLAHINAVIKSVRHKRAA